MAGVILLGLWLLMSGIYKPLMIGFALGSVLVVLFVGWRMDRVDGDKVQMRLRPFGFVGYILWLLVEIGRANWIVTKIILSRKMPIRQHLFAVPYSQNTDLGQVIFANSITLTPGTITVETEPGSLLVHALAYSPEDMAALADMDRRVSITESTTESVSTDEGGA
ncbi:MAG: Na+/H+ antiporter subunit E [Alphaproteobacteria bacterium]|nr:Na+/H+ antiporter subunit E [Alphaproteobacteria bacterium]